jgi:hypothetical protein
LKYVSRQIRLLPEQLQERHAIRGVFVVPG